MASPSVNIQPKTTLLPNPGLADEPVFGAGIVANEKALAPSWSYVLTDLAGNALGDLTGATERNLSLPLLRLPTAGFKLPVWHPRAADLLNGDCLLKVYRTPYTGTKSLVFNGPVISANEEGNENTQTVAAVAVGPLWRLGYRIIGTSKAGIQFPASGERDLGLIAHDILDTTNGQEFTGISKGVVTATQGGATGKWYLKVAGEAIAELTTGLNSFEFEIVPTEPTNVGGAGGWPQIGVMNCKPIVGGVQRDDAIFEYGTSRANVRSYARAQTRDGLMTRGYMSVNGWPDGTTQDLRVISDSAARTARGLFEAVAPDGGVLDDGLRDRLLQYHIDVRKQPREIITFSPALNARPSPFVDYNVGDYVRARAVVRDTVRFDSFFRVWGITFNIDANGNEAVELELVMP